jgi:transcription antitermination factor NusG
MSSCINRQAHRERVVRVKQAHSGCVVRVRKSSVAFLGCLALAGATLWAQQAAQTTASGTVTSVDTSNSSLVLKTDAGQELKVALQPRTSFRRVAPGATDLTKAEPIELGEIKAGDRVLTRGRLDNQTVTATLIVVMEKGDIAKKNQADQADWKARGVAGVVTGVSADSVTIRIDTIAGPKSMTLTPAADAIIRRYAPDSVNFQDAKPSTLVELKPGDQVRARGDKSADNSKMSAVEIVSGRFKTIAGVILSIDVAAKQMQVRDLETKKPVTVKLVADSTAKRIEPRLAQRIAAQLHGDSDDAAGRGRGRGGAGGGDGGQVLGGRGGDFGGRGGAGLRAGPNADIDTMLDASPNITIADVKTGDAIVVLSTEGATADKITAIKLLAGVEPILTKPGTKEMSLGSWSLGGLGGGGGD